MDNDTTGTPTSGVSRRSIALGTAWAVPAIMVASAAPAMAASGDIIQFSQSTACKIPGSAFKAYCYEKGYVLWAFLKYSVPIYVQINSMTVGGVAQCIVGLVDPLVSCNTAIANCVTVPTSGRYIGIFCNANTDSGSDLVQVGFTWSTTPGCAGGTAKVEQANLTGSPWQGSCTFPPGSSCTTPLTALGTGCAICS